MIRFGPIRALTAKKGEESRHRARAARLVWQGKSQFAIFIDRKSGLGRDKVFVAGGLAGSEII